MTLKSTSEISGRKIAGGLIPQTGNLILTFANGTHLASKMPNGKIISYFTLTDNLELKTTFSCSLHYTVYVRTYLIRILCTEGSQPEVFFLTLIADFHNQYHYILCLHIH